MERLMFGTAELRFNGVALGWIKDGSFDWGGTPGTTTEIRAAQVKQYPVKYIPQTNGTIKPTFQLIDFDYQGLVNIAGGSVITNEGGEVVGWNAPSELVMIEGEFEADTDSGHRVTIPSSMLTSSLTGGLVLTDVSQMDCAVSIVAPAKGVPPYRIEQIPDVAP